MDISMLQYLSNQTGRFKPRALLSSLFRKARVAMNPTPMRGAARPRLEPGIGLAAVVGQQEAVRALQERVVTPWNCWQHMAFERAEVSSKI